MSSEESLKDRLDEVVTEALQSVSPGVPTAWILLGHLANYDDNGDGVSVYPIILMNDSLPEHTIRGLLGIARDSVRGVGRWGHIDHDDEDSEGGE